MEAECRQASASPHEATAAVVARVARALSQTGHTQLVDLGSRAGSTVVSLLDQLAHQGTHATAVLTDPNPQPQSWETLSANAEGRVSYVEEPIEGSAVPESLVGLRTLLDRLHHLKPDQVRAVLADAVRAGMPLLALETTQRTWPALARQAFVPAAVWAITPTIRPFSLRRLAATYAVPLVPTAMAWDGLISTLGTYNREELEAFTTDLDAPGWTWDVGSETHNQTPVSWILGCPP